MARYVEVRPCRYVWHGTERHVVTVDDAPHAAQFWGVYAEDSEGRIMHKRDFTTQVMANTYAAQLRVEE